MFLAFTEGLAMKIAPCRLTVFVLGLPALPAFGLCGQPGQRVLRNVHVIAMNGQAPPPGRLAAGIRRKRLRPRHNSGRLLLDFAP